MADYLLRATAGGGNIRAVAAVTTVTSEEARRRHGAYPTAAAALGRALTAAALMGATLKEKQSITLRFAGDGPLGGITAEADSEGRVRGFVKQPKVHLPPNAQGKLDVGGAVGRNGFLYVVKDLGLKEMFTGTTELQTGEIGDDVTYYLVTSEQTPSAVGLGVLVDPDGSVRASGGYLLQLLPQTREEDRELLEKNLAELGAVSWAIDRGHTPETILAQVLQGLDAKILDKTDLAFRCKCSRERAYRTLATISPEDLRVMHEEDQGAEMTCQFCGEVYRLTEEELQEMLQGSGES